MPFDQFAQLHQATLDLLGQVGVFVESEAALALFAEHGVRIDISRQRVFPDAGQIDAMLATVPHTFPVYGRDAASTPLTIGGETPYILAGGASVRVLELDGQYAPATWEHLRQFITLLDALPHIHVLLNQVDPVEQKPNYYLQIAAEMLIGTPKPSAVQVQSAADLEAVIAMGACIRGSRAALREQPLFLTGINAEPPLCIPDAAAEVLCLAARAGVPCGLGDYVMMGTTAPLTLAGALVQRNAVQLTGLLLMQLAQPGAPCYYSAPSGAVDLHTLNPIMANPFAARMLRTSTQLGRSYGLPVWTLATTDARQPDPQAACERTAHLQIALASGASLIQGPTSMMDQMMLSSFAQVIIDHDIIGYLLTAQAPVEVTEETLAMGAIREVVTDPLYREMKFGAHPHTVDHLHDATWQPSAFDYRSFVEWQRDGAVSVVERAAACVRQILAHHQPEPLNPAVAARLRAIAEGALVERG